MSLLIPPVDPEFKIIPILKNFHVSSVGKGYDEKRLILTESPHVGKGYDENCLILTESPHVGKGYDENCLILTDTRTFSMEKNGQR